MRVLLRVAYDGTAYSGWQAQPNAVTIEQKLSEALMALTGGTVEITGASRTDAGVHALGNVAVFDTETRIPAEKFAFALNSRLPGDIRIVESRQVRDDFHPRRVDCVKTYEYTIWNDAFENPLMRLYSYFCYGDMDTDEMARAASVLVGKHDFTAFCSAGSQVEDKTRTVYSIDVERNGKIIIIRAVGNGFLYNMVRIIAGTLIEVGRHKMTVCDVREALESRDRQKAGPTAPAKGLKLVRIEYKESDL